MEKRYNIKVDLREVWLEGVVWNLTAQNTSFGWALANTV
jgi:hypothetical protein